MSDKKLTGNPDSSHSNDLDASAIPGRVLAVEEFKNCSLNSVLGTCKITCPAALEDEVHAWLEFLAGAVEELLASGGGSADVGSPAAAVSDIRGSGANWQRLSRKEVFPFYVEAVIVADGVEADAASGLPAQRVFPGTYRIDGTTFDPAQPGYFRSNTEQWRTWVSANMEQDGFCGGLSVNLLEVPAEALRDGVVDVRPLTLHAIAPDGSAPDRGDVDAQAAIANAFWQTFWATGATRAERGSVFPVAFLPVDRSSRFEFAEPFHERYVSLRRRLFGRSAILGYAIERLSRARALVFNRSTLEFQIAPDFSPQSADVASADVILAIGELNRTGFVDAYTGENAEQFSGWLEREKTLQRGSAWPFGEAGASAKIKAAGHGIADPLQAVRATGEQLPDCAVIHRVVPYAGCAFLYQVMTETDALRQRGKIQDLEGELVAGTNSTFFLNFPEEYSALHSAMNEPVALLVENGKTRQIKTLRRAAFILGEDGQAMITTRAGNHLESDVLVFEGESSSATYFDNAERSFAENVFGPLFFGAAVVGDSIVETFEEITTEVPPAGWLIGDSEAFGGRIQPEHVARVQVRQAGSLKEAAIRHAFAVGPLLLEDGEVVPLWESREEFCSLNATAVAGFDETSRLSRTELPDALLNCPARGVPPTRFPYDWNVTRAPRSAIGVRADGTVIISVVDGRADIGHSVGATLAELAAIMKGLGCEQAMNMDGGGSSVMFINDAAAAGAKLRPALRDGVVSLPSDMGGTERLLPVPLVVVKR